MAILTTTQALAWLAGSDAARMAIAERRVRVIVEDVRRHGDAATERWAKRLDRVDPPFEVSAGEIRAGWAATPAIVRRAIRRSIRHIERVAAKQMPRPFQVDVRPGVRIEQRIAPLERVGCYVPAGRSPLPSTVIMTVVPARVAGVRDVIVFCPRPTPAVLAAALEAGATRVYRLGGAHAIAAAAYGTASIPRVDKIVGPGNRWVTAAKQLVSRDCAIDFCAGPSEIVVWSDRGRADWIAADLDAQAEHDADAHATAVTTRLPLARAIDRELSRGRPRRPNVTIVRARDHADAISFINRVAPEHLVCDHATAASACVAGTIFVGEWSAQAAGDYATGSNHVLPTGGAARARGGLSAADFVRVFTVQTLTRSGLRSIAPDVIALANAEGLSAHAESILVRTGGRR